MYGSCDMESCSTEALRSLSSGKRITHLFLIPYQAWRPLDRMASGSNPNGAGSFDTLPEGAVPCGWDWTDLNQTSSRDKGKERHRCWLPEPNNFDFFPAASARARSFGLTCSTRVRFTASQENPLENHFVLPHDLGRGPRAVVGQFSGWKVSEAWLVSGGVVIFGAGPTSSCMQRRA